MQRLLFIILGLIFWTSVPASAQVAPVEGESVRAGSDWDNSSQVEDWSVRAFVGKKIFVEARAKPEYMDIKMPDGRIVTRRIPAMDSRYEARYEILDVVKGPLEDSTFDFVAFDHYGRPRFPHVEHVLLFVVSHESEWMHSKYLFYSVHRTTDGDWAICGKPYVDERADGAHKKLAASYEEPIGFIDPVELPDGGVCNTGTRARNLFNFQEKYRFIPRRNRVMCNQEIGLEDYIVAGTGPNAEIEKQKHAACMERLNVAALSKGRKD